MSHAFAHMLCQDLAHLGFADCSGLTFPLALSMVADGAADDAAGLGESVSLEAGDLPRKGRLLPILFHPAFSCVAAAEICTQAQQRSSSNECMQKLPAWTEVQRSCFLLSVQLGVLDMEYLEGSCSELYGIHGSHRSGTILQGACHQGVIGWHGLQGLTL